MGVVFNSYYIAVCPQKVTCIGVNVNVDIVDIVYYINNIYFLAVPFSLIVENIARRKGLS